MKHIVCIKLICVNFYCILCYNSTVLLQLVHFGTVCYGTTVMHRKGFDTPLYFMTCMTLSCNFVLRPNYEQKRIYGMDALENAKAN